MARSEMTYQSKAKRLVLCLVMAISLCFCMAFLAACGSKSEEVIESLTTTTTVEEDNVSNNVNYNQLPDSSFLYDADISDLINADTFYDGQTVQITGEVVGDRISSEDEYDNYWIAIQKQNVQNPGCISVLMNGSQASLIDTYGNYKHTGTTLQVRGTYNLACKNHQGLSDIHAQEVTVVKKGAIKDNQVNSVILTAGILSVLLGGALAVFYNYRKEREL